MKNRIPEDGSVESRRELSMQKPGMGSDYRGYRQNSEKTEFGTSTFKEVMI